MIEKIKPKKILLHVECLQGVGEITQAVSLTSQLLKRGAEVEVVTASGYQSFDEFQDKLSPDEKARFSLHQLPRIDLEHNASDTLEQRTGLVLEHAKGADNIILASGWPMWLGEGILDQEMHALLDYAKTQNISSSLFTREVMQGDSPMMQGGEQAVTTLFKENPALNWIVMGDKHLTPLSASYESAEAIDARKIFYAGYGADTDKSALSRASLIRKEPEKVVVNSGGGDFSHTPASFHTLHAALVAARMGAFSDAEWTIIAGKGHPEEKKQMLRDLAEPLNNVNVVETLPYDEFQATLRGNTVFIGELGIGAASDLIKNKTRAIIVPKTADITTRLPDNTLHTAHFTEQRTRTKAFQSAGLVRAVYADEQEILVAEHHLGDYDINTLASGINRETQHIDTLDPSRFDSLATNGYKNAAEAITTNFRINQQQSEQKAQR